MTTKYQHVPGGSPISETVSIPGYAPIDVYHFNFLKHASHLLLDEQHLMKDSLLGYNNWIDPVSGEQLYAEMNSSDFWKFGKEYVAKQVNDLHPSLNDGDGLPHYLCLVILCINIG